jgi:hypothetical protein
LDGTQVQLTITTYLTFFDCVNHVKAASETLFKEINTDLEAPVAC